MRQEWLDSLPSIRWDASFTLAVVSAAVGSVAALAWVSARDIKARRRQRRDTALEVAISLESFARTCRTMMHKAAWASAVPTSQAGRDAAAMVSMATFAYPEKIRWDALSHKVVSELREYPAAVHAVHQHVEAFREFGEPLEVCAQVEYECAKAALAALALARTTRRRHGARAWKPGARDSAIERELSDFVAAAEAKRKAALERRSEVSFGRRTDTQPLQQPLTA
jgi:hypothetical protein